MARRTFTASNTHLFPGARLVARSGGALRRGAHIVIEFADLGVTTARVDAVQEGRIDLSVAAHRTRRGADVAAKHWLVERDHADRERTVYRTLRRLPRAG